MDPISSLLVGHAAGKLLDKFGQGFKTHVIDRWSHRRATEFVEQFCKEVAQEGGGDLPEDLDDRLTKIVKDELCSQILFDAYRRVALSRSRVLGPRIIALLTAELVAEQRPAGDSEDAILTAAESLTDDELLAFLRFVRDQEAKRSLGSNQTRPGLRIKWCDERFDSLWRQSISTGPLDLNECLGRWAGKLESYGIIQTDMQEREVDHDPASKRSIVESQRPHAVREITWWINVSAENLRLADLIYRAGGNGESNA